MKSTPEQLCVLRDCVMERLILLVRVLATRWPPYSDIADKLAMIGGDHYGVSLGMGGEKKA